MFNDRDDLTVDRHLIVAQRLRARRLQLGLTQKQLVSRLTHQGIRTTNKTLSGFERGAGLDVVRLPELAAGLECTVTYLLGLTDDPLSWEPRRRRRPAPAPRPTPAARPTPAPAPAPVGSAEGNWILAPDVPALRTSR